MKRKIGEIGKITASTVIIVALVAVVGYFIYSEYQRRTGETGISFSLILYDGTKEPISSRGTTDFKLSPVLGQLVLDDGRAVQGIEGTLWIQPAATNPENVKITLTEMRLRWYTLPGSALKTDQKFTPPPSFNVPINVKTTTNVSMTAGSEYSDMPGYGTYYILWTFEGKGDQTYATADFKAEGTLNVTWKADTLTITASVDRNPFKIE